MTLCRTRIVPQNLAFLAILAISIVTCGGNQSQSKKHSEAATVASKEIAKLVLEHRIKTAGIEAKAALDELADTARFAAAYEEEHPDFELGSELREHLHRRRRVRLWLAEKFEPTHQAQHIPEPVLLENLNDPSILRRYFHPQLHAICQMIVMPKDALDEQKSGEKTKPDDAFRARALDLTQSFRRALKAAQHELFAEKKCDTFFAMARYQARSTDERIEIRTEKLVMDIRSETWDADFRAAVQVVQEPAIVEPFLTAFGLHIVAVVEVREASLPDDSELAPDALQRARLDVLRDKIYPAWRRSAYNETLEQLRKTYSIYLSAQLRNGWPNASPP